MKYITLNNGIKMPIIGFGTWDLRENECEKATLEALKIGYRLIDTAQMYQNEKEVGNAIRKSGIPRKEIFVTTKIYRPDTTYEKVKKAIDKSLQELQLDYIDLLLIHEPYSTSLEMYQAMAEAYQDGKIKAIGISNFNSSFYKKFIKKCGIIPAVNQVECHVFFRREELQETMKKHKTIMQAWSPLAAGKEGIFTNDILVKIGEKYHKTAAQISLRYLLQNEIVVIPKSSHKERMKENLDILNFKLEDDDMKRIRKLDKNKSLFDW